MTVHLFLWVHVGPHKSAKQERRVCAPPFFSYLAHIIIPQITAVWQLINWQLRSRKYLGGLTQPLRCAYVAAFCVQNNRGIRYLSPRGALVHRRRGRTPTHRLHCALFIHARTDGWVHWRRTDFWQRTWRHMWRLIPHMTCESRVKSKANGYRAMAWMWDRIYSPFSLEVVSQSMH